MNIEISTKEYRDLLDILHIADVVISGHRKEEDARTKRHSALIQKLYALAGGEGLDHLISYNERVSKHIPTDEYEKSNLAHVLIDEFGDHLFWDELIARLSVRDAAQVAGGIDRLNTLNDSARQAVEGPIRQRYLDEFSAHGMANLEVVERFSTGGEMLVKTSD